MSLLPSWMPQVLRAWLREHTAEDVIRSSKMPAVYNIVQPDFTVETCIGSAITPRQQSLLIRDPNGIINWLRLEDVIRLALEGELSAPCLTIPKTHCITLPANVSIWDMLVAWDRGIDWHRPLVITDAQEGIPNAILGIVAPGDILHYIYIYGWQLVNLLSQGVHLLDWDGKSLPLLYRGDPAYKALEMLLDPKSPGIIGLVERRGNLVGDINLPSLVPVQEDNLDLSIRDYLDMAHYKYGMVTCSEKLTFGELLSKVVMHDTNHVWKLNTSGQPIGLIHLSHMLKFVKKQTGISECI